YELDDWSGVRKIRHSGNFPWRGNFPWTKVKFCASGMKENERWRKTRPATEKRHFQPEFSQLRGGSLTINPLHFRVRQFRRH
ncbi:MAG: hypothetical protein ACKV2V_08210, partial [Blastocatellia bacterium]